VRAWHAVEVEAAAAAGGGRMLPLDSGKVKPLMGNFEAQD
jgi:hypothetical protein